MTLLTTMIFDFHKVRSTLATSLTILTRTLLLVKTSLKKTCSNAILFSDWNGVVIAFMVLGLLFHLVAFIFAIIAACRKGHPFPSFWVAGLFFIAGEFSLGWKCFWNSHQGQEIHPILVSLWKQPSPLAPCQYRHLEKKTSAPQRQKFHTDYMKSVQNFDQELWLFHVVVILI